MASTIRDVAARAGLSVGTVSKYINGKTVKESTRLAIEEAIKELDFHPNNIAKGLRNAKSFSVAILLPMLDSTFCTSMISSIESTLLPLGYSVIVCECHNNAEIKCRSNPFESGRTRTKNGAVALSDMLPALFCIEALCSFSGPFGGPFFYKLCKFIKSYILSKSPLNALVISI